MTSDGCFVVRHFQSGCSVVRVGETSSEKEPREELTASMRVARMKHVLTDAFAETTKFSLGACSQRRTINLPMRKTMKSIITGLTGGHSKTIGRCASMPSACRLFSPKKNRTCRHWWRGSLNFITKHFSKAAPIAEQILQIKEQTLGPDNRGTAVAANNLAEVYRYMGQYAKADPLYQRALTIFEKELGPEHPDVASVLNNVALLDSETGEYAKAESIYQRVLKIREAAFGPDNPETAETLNALAALYYYMGQYAKAEPLYKRALKIREKAFGPNNPKTAPPSTSPALYVAQDDYAKAEKLFQRALKFAKNWSRPSGHRSHYANLAAPIGHGPIQKSRTAPACQL